MQGNELNAAIVAASQPQQQSNAGQNQQAAIGGPTQQQQVAQQQHQQQQQQNQLQSLQAQQPQVITLQQLQNFLPQQIPQIQTITSADGQTIQMSAPNNGPGTPIKQERLFVTPQMQSQVLNLQNVQGIPQQFIQVISSEFEQIDFIIIEFKSAFAVSGWSNTPKCWQWNVSSGSTDANGYC